MNTVDMNGRVIQILDNFEKLEQEIAALLIKNHDLFKLLRDAHPDPLAQPINDEIIEDMITEFLPNGERNPRCRLFFEPFLSTAQTEIISMLRLYPAQINPVNVYEGELYLQADIIVHQSISRTKSGRRRNRILSELIKSLNGQSIKMLNTLTLLSKPVTLRQFNGDFWGYSLLLKTAIGTVR